jgi:hypothetical protein
VIRGRAEIDASDLRVDRWNILIIAIPRCRSGKVVCVHERRVECFAQGKRFFVDGRRSGCVEIGSILQPPAQAAAMNIDQRIDVIEQVGRDRVCQALGNVPLT